MVFALLNPFNPFELHFKTLALSQLVCKALVVDKFILSVIPLGTCEKAKACVYREPVNM